MDKEEMELNQIAMTKEELEKEAKEYTKNLLKKLGIKEDMLLENQPKYLRQESMNFVALNIENVTDAYLASAIPREKKIALLEELLDECGNSTKELMQQIKKMSELINRYYEVCVQIPKELRTMVFDSCLEDTQKMITERETK